MITIIFNWSTWQGNIIQPEISSVKLQKPLLACLMCYSTFSIHCTNLILCLKELYVFFNLSWNIKHDMLKMLLFIFHLKQQNTTKKFTNFAKIFLKYTLIWQLWQYNLIKLFQKKLKTAKHYYNHLTEEKKNEFFWPTHIFYNRNLMFIFLESNQPLTVKLN